MEQKYIEKHLSERRTRGFTNEKFGWFYDGRILQICFYSIGCRCCQPGGCIMCDYGAPRQENLKPDDIKKIFDEIFAKVTPYPKVLLLNAIGSVLDEREIPQDVLSAILYEVKRTNTQVVIFETHYTTVTEKILQQIKKVLSEKTLELEFGFESVNPEYRKKYLNKDINNDNFLKVIELANSNGFDVEANVIFGIPFLTTEEQIKDSIKSIKWLIENGVSEVDLFPMNIKPYTLLYKLYEEGNYSPVSHTDFIKVLRLIPPQYLNRIHLCWFGNREISYGAKKTILPIYPEGREVEIRKFYSDFNKNKDAEQRNYLLEKISNLIK